VDPLDGRGERESDGAGLVTRLLPASYDAEGTQYRLDDEGVSIGMSPPASASGHPESRVASAFCGGRVRRGDVPVALADASTSTRAQHDASSHHGRVP
jgi:hypothetical protein